MRPSQSRTTLSSAACTRFGILLMAMSTQSRTKERTVADAKLIDTLLKRRSRRFSRGMQLGSGPLAFESKRSVEPLTIDQEALLAFAAVGITGPALGEMEYTSGTTDAGAGNVLAGFVGRTAASADALQSVGLVIMNDGGTWYIPRPQDLERSKVRELLDLSNARQFTKWYDAIRVRIS